MASVARNFTRVALALARSPATRPKPRNRFCTVAQQYRSFTNTPIRAARNDRDDADEAEEEAFQPTEEGEMTDEDREHEAMLEQIDREADSIEREMPDPPEEGEGGRPSMWADGEEPDDSLSMSEEEWKDDSMTSMAHAELDEHRDIREFMRIAAWDMPSLSHLAKPFSLPPDTHVLRFRYTTYMGESHPAESKVVMELCSKDLAPTHLTEAQRQTFLKLVGTRYNPDKDLIRMSCEKFPTAAQNKRYLGDLINSLIKEAKENDSFADIPLDTRHHKPKPRLHFPASWAMTEEKKAQIEAARAERKQKELERLQVVDGNQAVADAPRKLSEPARGGALGDKIPVPVGGRGKDRKAGWRTL